MRNSLVCALISISMCHGCTNVTYLTVDHDFDGDGAVDPEDNCPTLDNPGQENADGDLLGDVCDDEVAVFATDFDGDGTVDATDNCPTLDNADQSNWDGDMLGDVCDDDDDNDDWLDAVDNCRLVANDQADADLDFIGDACDTMDATACPAFVSAEECGGGWALCELESIDTVPTGSVVMATGPAIYYYGNDHRRYVFPNLTTFHSWYPTTDSCPVIRQVSDADLASVIIGGNVTIRPGTRLVKITTDPKIYAITEGGVLHWIESESLIAAVYGPGWRSELVDVPDAFFVNYSIGASISRASDYNRSDVLAGTTTVGQDLGIDP